jgi:hypothetical protein
MPDQYRGRVGKKDVKGCRIDGRMGISVRNRVLIADVTDLTQ